MTKPLALTLFIGLLGACTNTNQINTLIDEEKHVHRSSTEPMRFQNVYNKKQHYPVTCENDCYPNHDAILCQAEMEHCHFSAPQAQPKLATGFNVQWLGHASFMIRINEQHILIDPVSEQFDWPVNWAFRMVAGFNRKTPQWPDIKAVSAVLYSHIHYDHFNKSDIAQMGEKPTYFVPLGFAEHFPNNHYRINEMAWYSTAHVNQTQFHFVPAHHFSSRIQVPFIYNDDDQTLWGGWVIEHQNKKLFFAGDTGYSAHFNDIKQKYGEMDVCLMPIASYYHQEYGDWYRHVHTTPEDALIASQELGCKVMIPWGYGNASWKMGDHTSHSALFRLLHMQQQLNHPVPLYILNEGDEISL